LHQVGDLFELNVKLRCQEVNLALSIHMIKSRELKEVRYCMFVCVLILIP